MIIRELQINHFGKFHDKVIELKPGLNIIYGPNEAGKSTIHYFIRAMLFGIERLRGKGAANDAYSRYLPWDSGQTYEGLMIMEHEGRVFRLYRNFYKTDTTFRVFDHETGNEIKLKTGQIDELIPGLTESEYCNTISVGQQESRVDDKFATSLQSYMANMSMAKSESIDIRRAMEYLAEEEKKVRGQMPSRQIEQLKHDIENLGDKDINIIQRDIERYQQKEQEIRQRIDRYQRQRASIEKQEQAERTEGIRLLEQRRALLYSLKHEEELAETKDKRSHIWKQESFKLFVIFTFIAVALMGVQLGLSIDNVIFKVLTGLMLIVAVISLAKTSFKKTKDDIDLQYYEERMGKLQRQLEPYVRKYGPKMTNSGTLGDIQESLEQQRSQLTESVKHRERLEWEREQKEELLAKQTILEEMLDEKNQKNRSLRTELEALALAKMVINDLATEIHQQFGNQMNNRVAEIFADISCNEEKKILIDEKMNIHIDGIKQHIPLNRLSTGTIDQIYFALRFCAADIIFKGEQFPLIADDSFAFYDDFRLKNILTWLSQQKRSQILLFTCHQREIELLNQLGIKFNLIDLSTE